MHKCSPSKCCKLPVSAGLCFVGKSTERDGERSSFNRENRPLANHPLSEVAEKSVSARPGPILEGTVGTRMGPGRAGMAPTSGPGWVRNAGKQSTWRIWMGPLRIRDGTWTGPGPDPGEGLDGTPRDSNRLLGLSDFSKPPEISQTLVFLFLVWGATELSHFLHFPCAGFRC